MKEKKKLSYIVEESERKLEGESKREGSESGESGE